MRVKVELSEFDVLKKSITTSKGSVIQETNNLMREVNNTVENLEAKYSEDYVRSDISEIKRNIKNLQKLQSNYQEYLVGFEKKITTVKDIYVQSESAIIKDMKYDKLRLMDRKSAFANPTGVTSYASAVDDKNDKDKYYPWDKEYYIESKTIIDQIDDIFRSEKEQFFDGHIVDGHNICEAYVENIEDCYYIDDEGNRRFKGYYTVSGDVMIDERGLYPIQGWVVEHSFEHIGLSVYETFQSEDGFNVSGVDARNGKTMSFIPADEDRVINTIDEMQQFNYEHRTDKPWAWTKVAISVTSDAITVITLGAGGLEAEAGEKAVLEVLEHLFKPGKGAVVTQVITNTGDYITEGRIPIDDATDLLKWGGSWVTFAGTAIAVYDATSDEPIKGIFLEN